MPISRVLIVGAGPAGLTLGLLLANAGVPVLLLDAATALDENPRATHYGPPAVYELRRAGVLDEVLAKGYVPNGVAWRKLDGTVLAAIENAHVPADMDRMVCLPLNKLCRVLYERLEKREEAEVRWGWKVTGVGQDDGKAWVEAETPAGGKERVEAEYVVGCDGANSIVRRSLFGDWNFPGRTWDEQIVATNVYYDVSAYNWHDSNFIVDPHNWYMLAKIQPDGLLRVTYGDTPGLTRDEYVARQPQRYEEFLPGHPKPHQYKVVNISPYKVHQRCAERMRVGRFMLAADAAHLCNPFGGLGLTGGLVDVGGLYDCLAGIHRGVATPSILDRYDEIRRQKYRDMIDPISSENIRRNWQDPDKALEVDPFLQLCNRANKDPELSRQMQLGIMQLRHDFTQYYTEGGEEQPVGDGAKSTEEIAAVPGEV